MLQSADSVPLVAANAVIDFLFLMDILINFRTTYINPKTGDEITEVTCELLLSCSRARSLRTT